MARRAARRHSLPDLDEDHERINRSIETFLSGSETSDDAAGPDTTTVATTVALVAIDGLATDPSVVDPGAVKGVVATVERTLRDAARSADRVTPVGTGRFRVVLPATGELAARAYLRRVRATVGPSLEAADGPLGLVTATATVLDEFGPDGDCPGGGPTRCRPGECRQSRIRRRTQDGGRLGAGGLAVRPKPHLADHQQDEEDRGAAGDREVEDLLEPQRTPRKRVAPGRRDDRPGEGPRAERDQKGPAVEPADRRDRQETHQQDHDRDRRQRLVDL